MDELITRLFNHCHTEASCGEFLQVTVREVIATVENLVAEHRRSFRVIHGWNRSHYMDLPILPGNRQLPLTAYQDISDQLDSNDTSIYYLYDDGTEAFSLVGHLVSRPEVSVFQQRLPVKIAWSFNRSIQRELIAALEKQIPFRATPLHGNLESVHLHNRFPAKVLGVIEGQLQETRQTLFLIEGIMRVQKAIARELDFERLLELIGHTLVDTFHFQLGELELYDSDEDRLVHQVTWHNAGPGKTLSQNLQVLLDVQLEREAFLNGVPVVMENVRNSPLVLNHKLMEILGLRFGIILPLYANEEKVGLFKMYFGQREIFSPNRLRWLDQLSKLMASAILNAREHTRVFELATKDVLTSLHNRRYFEEQFNMELARTQRSGHSLCLLMLDVDHFKNYNDRNGHLAGDQVLVDVALLIKSSIRTVDLIARYGGEEFIVLLSGADQDVGLKVGEKIRAAIEERDFPHGESQPGGRLTVSIGVAQLEGGMQNMKDLIRRADSALYKAKGAGRNQVLAAT